ncbi:MAG: hypothetical protein E7336_11610 [Clostridiales bacterium]|nr:hypothetical protein [Clostridiales bacterium]
MSKKLVALLMAAIMLCSFASFASAEATYPEYLNLVDTYYPMVKEGYEDKVEIDVTIIVGTDFSADPSQRYFWQLMEKVFNIHFNVTQVTNKEEYITLTFAADDLPDLILGAGLTPAQIYEYGVIEEQLLDVTPYLTPELAPQLNKLFEQYADLRSTITLPNGAIYCFPNIRDYDNPENYTVTSINVKMMEEVGVTEKPKTLDELVDLLYKFKALGDDVIPLCGAWENCNPSAMILNALGFETKDHTVQTGSKVTVRNGEVVLPAADPVYKDYLELMNKFYTDGIIDKDFFTNDSIVLQAQTAEKRIGVLGQRCYALNSNPDFYLDFESLPVLTSAQNSDPFCATSSSISFGGCLISSKTQYPELLVRWCDWMVTYEGTNAAWVGANKYNEGIMLEGWGGWYMNENYSRCDVDRETYPEKWTGAVQYLREQVAGFNMGSLGLVAGEDWYRQTMSGLPYVDKTETWAKDPMNAGFYYRTSAYEEYTPYLRTDISTISFFFDEDTTDRIIELEAVLKDKIENETAKFITGARPLSEFDAFQEELKKLGVEEYVGYYAESYAATQGK